MIMPLSLNMELVCILIISNVAGIDHFSIVSCPCQSIRQSVMVVRWLVSNVVTEMRVAGVGSAGQWQHRVTVATAPRPHRGPPASDRRSSSQSRTDFPAGNTLLVTPRDTA